jgi:hypothetical protein
LRFAILFFLPFLSPGLLFLIFPEKNGCFQWFPLARKRILRADSFSIIYRLDERKKGWLAVQLATVLPGDGAVCVLIKVVN